jgi:serine/threonine protein kinase
MSEPLRDDPASMKNITGSLRSEHALERSHRYRLLDEIARGGMGVVFRATDTALSREVAVKVLQDRFTEASEAARRFVDEARIAGQLQHPGIPAIHDLGTLPDGRPFLAMKLMKGQTLSDLLKRRATPDDERGRFVAVFEHVWHAVGYAHAHGVIHRDLKPANVTVGVFGEVQVMDRGLAKTLAARDRLEVSDVDPNATVAGTVIHSGRDGTDSETRAGTVLGTPAYMAPEQAAGALAKVDQRSDVFGLGAILAVILTGQPPFPASSHESARIQAAQGRLDDCFARLDACGAEPELLALCKRCLSPNRDARPVDANEVGKAVAEILASADERARQAEVSRATAEVRNIEERKRARTKSILSLIVARALGIAGITLGLVQKLAAERDRLDSEKKAADLNRQVEDAQRAAAEGARLARNEEAIAALLERCEEALRVNDVSRAAVAYEAVQKRLNDGVNDRLSARWHRLQSELAMSRDLDEIDQFRWTLAESELNRAAVVEKYTAAFARFLDEPLSSPSPVSIQRVKNSVIRDRLVVNLDRLLRNAPGPEPRVTRCG